MIEFRSSSACCKMDILLQDGIVGPPKKLDWEARAKKEEHTTSEAAKKVLWECSEQAIGHDFFQVS